MKKNRFYAIFQCVKQYIKVAMKAIYCSNALNKSQSQKQLMKQQNAAAKDKSLDAMIRIQFGDAKFQAEIGMIEKSYTQI